MKFGFSYYVTSVAVVNRDSLYILRLCFSALVKIKKCAPNETHRKMYLICCHTNPTNPTKNSKIRDTLFPKCFSLLNLYSDLRDKNNLPHFNRKINI